MAPMYVGGGVIVSDIEAVEVLDELDEIGISSAVINGMAFQ